MDQDAHGWSIQQQYFRGAERQSGSLSRLQKKWLEYKSPFYFYRSQDTVAHPPVFLETDSPGWPLTLTHYLITGASGFVGQAMIGKLMAENDEKRDKISGVVRRPLPENSRLKQFVLADMNADTDWLPYLNRIDVVFHLAARVHIMHAVSSDALDAFQRINWRATVRLAEQAAACGVRRFVYVSSIKVNGEYTSRGHTFSEADSASPQDPYALSKWQAEQSLMEISARTGMELVIARPPLVYGAGVKANLLSLMRLIDKGIPLPFGGIHNKRSLLYIGNLVDALLQCANHEHAAGKTFLLSDAYAVSTPELCQCIAHSLGRPLRLVNIHPALLSSLAGLVGKSSVVDRLTQSLEVDNSKICRELSWSPPYSIEQGFYKTAEWFRSAYNK